ncbi:hypothetical protein [Pseudoalteromonas ardens]|uniref:Lipoprotein n=1 Tax=Pseudoalteromonas rubra TaxID=43658 RepID=A0A0L0ERQ4_9GAMM|nr:hypothetical protein [Pseudoalteromonas sp. R96]KNC67162.1 hypothetical protein AC626_12500 [Pseudoalteromonas rubra]MDK1309892.1 hypothetical protein [Pseudoalteromonas sp. R96]
MFKYSKIAMGLAACFALSGCLEVEDNNNNDELVNKLEQQNQILQNQLDENKKQAEAELEKEQLLEAPFTIIGGIKGAVDGVVLSDVQITPYFDGEWKEPIAVAEDGSFSIPKVPQYTPVLIKVSSPSNAIVTKLFTHQTNSSGGRTEAISNIFDSLVVSRPHTVKFDVLNRENFEKITELSFKAVPELDGSYSGMARHTYRHLLEQNNTAATYNEENGNYELVVAEGVPFALEVDLDVDNDGLNDYQISTERDSYYYSTSSNSLEFHNFNPVKTPTLYATVNELNEYDLAVRFINQDGTEFTPENVFAVNNDFGQSELVFDQQHGYYKLAAKYYGDLNIISGEFVADDIVYSANSINIERESAKSYSFTNLSHSGDEYRLHNAELDGNTLAITIPVKQKIDAPYLQVELVQSTSSSVAETQEMSYYFSSPVALQDDSLQLYKKNVLTVVKGNASTEDSVQPGTTYISQQDQVVALTKELSFNDTKLSAKPESALEPGYEYKYQLQQVARKSNGQPSYIHHDANFTIPAEVPEFDKSQFKADNFNYRHKAYLVKERNTAGIRGGNNSSDDTRSVCVVAPANVYLQKVEMVAVTVNDFKVSVSEMSYGYQHEYFFAAADNEQVYNDTYRPIVKSSAQPDGYYNYTCFNYVYHRDMGYWGDYIKFEDDKLSFENSIDVKITYRLEGSDEEKTTDRMTLKID